MKFLVNTRTFREQLELTEGTVPRNPMMPILENFLFNIADGRLQVTVSDLQVTCITSLNVEAKEEGIMAIPASIFLQTLKELPEEIITISFDQENYSTEIQASKGHYKISSENPADFPASQAVEDGVHVTIPTELLRTAFGRTKYAMSNDELRPAMNGLLVNLSGEGIVCVGTDGHRLVTYSQENPKVDTERSLIIPRKAVQMIDKILKKTSAEEVDMHFSAARAHFQIGEVEIICQLIDERFPDYQKVIPSGNKNYVTLDRAEVLSSLSRIAIYANKGTRQMRLKVTGEQLTLAVEDLDFSNEANESLSCVHEGEDITIGFNVEFLADVLNNIEATQIRLELSDPNRAVLARPVVEGNVTAQNLALIMPIMLENN